MTTPRADDILAHYGVKGMKWGIRKQRKSGEPRKPLTRNQKLAIAGGVGAAVVGIAATAVLLKTRGSVPVSSITKPAEEIKKAVEEKLGDGPDALIMSTRGRGRGAHFMRTGGLSDALAELDRGGFEGDGSAPPFQRFGDNMEKIRARILDPEGRLDRSGRIIPHEFIIPRDLAKDINNLDDVREKIWPLVESEYAAMYKDS